ncbi:MAG: lipoprotein Spr [Bacteroidetes bacterium HLUCCA01]|nr:MAG: lipoprotein Spr [Bacteroidetes bacterium HLUCCA01]
MIAARQTLLRTVAVMLLLVLIGSCASSRKSARSVESRLMEMHDRWQGTPYVLGGTSRSGVDCSAFVMIVMREQFGINLPRTTREQMRTGTRVRKSRLRAGDMVFFRTGRNTYHVGIMLDGDRFLHASTSRGPMVSRLDERYWSRRYLRSRRIM